MGSVSQDVGHAGSFWWYLWRYMHRDIPFLSCCFGLTTQINIRQTCGHVHLFRSVYSCPECFYSAIVTHVTVMASHSYMLSALTNIVWMCNLPFVWYTLLTAIDLLHTLFSLLHIFCLCQTRMNRGIPHWFEKNHRMTVSHNNKSCHMLCSCVKRWCACLRDILPKKTYQNICRFQTVQPELMIVVSFQ